MPKFLRDFLYKLQKLNASSLVFFNSLIVNQQIIFMWATNQSFPDIQVVRDRRCHYRQISFLRITSCRHSDRASGFRFGAKFDWRANNVDVKHMKGISNLSRQGLRTCQFCCLLLAKFAKADNAALSFEEWQVREGRKADPEQQGSGVSAPCYK